MPLPVPYIQNYSIEFSRISGYYTKKKTAKRFGPFQISVAETEGENQEGEGQKEAALDPRAIGVARAQETPSEPVNPRRGPSTLSPPPGCSLCSHLVILPCFDIYKNPLPNHPPVILLIVTPKFSFLCSKAQHNSHKIVQNVQPFTHVHTREDNRKHCFSMQASNNK